MDVRRELVDFRFPVADGEGNPPWRLRAAATAVVRGIAPDEVLGMATRGGPEDVSPSWRRDVPAVASPGRVRP